MDDSILFPKQATRGLESTDMVSRKTRKRGQKLPPPHVTKGHLQSSHPPTHTPGENGIVMNTVADNKETSGLHPSCLVSGIGEFTRPEDLELITTNPGAADLRPQGWQPSTFLPSTSKASHAAAVFGTKTAYKHRHRFQVSSHPVYTHGETETQKDNGPAQRHTMNQ